MIPYFGGLKPERLTFQDLEKYRDERGQDPVTKYRRGSDQPIIVEGKMIQPSTINRELTVLRASLNYALEHDHRLAFRIPPFPIARERNVRKGFQTEERFEKLLQQLPYCGVRALAATSFYTGVRKGELRRVNWDQVDFAAGVITLFDTKNGEAREVPILDGLMRQSLEEAKAERDQWWPECEAVFIYEGQRLGDPKRSWKTATKKTGDEGLLFHDMRRSANRNLRDIGVPQPIRMAMMGHRTTSMDRRYGIVDRTDLDIVRELHNRKRATEPLQKPLQARN